MPIKAMLVAILAMFPSVAFAQMINNNGTTIPADTSALGQAAPFENITTNFDGVTFKLVRLIADPSEGSMYRLVGALNNSGSKEVEILFFLPAPTLIDELGNVLKVFTATGIEACRNNRNWTSNINYCDDSVNVRKASRVAPNVPIPFSLGFAPSKENYNADLAALSNTVTMRVHFVYSLDTFKTMKTAEIVIPGIPLPR